MSISNQTPILSIVIVAYRSRNELSDCLGSLPREIDAKSVEIIVADNSPQDGVGAWVSVNYPEVKYLGLPQNLGFGRANNRGYAESRGECILFLNPDTICDGPAITHCLDRIQKEKTIGIVSPKLVLKDGSMDLACRRSVPTLWDGFCRAAGLAGRFPLSRRFAGYNLTYLPENGTYDVGAVNGAFMLMRRAVLLEVGAFDETFFMYGDDLDLCIRVAKAGYRIVYDGRVQITHLKGLSVAKEYERMSRAIFDANLGVYLKHFNPRNSRLTVWKYTAAFALWKFVALVRARWVGHRRVRPL